MAMVGANMADVDPNPDYTLDSLLDLYFGSLFPLIYTLVLIAAIVASNLYINRKEKKNTALGLAVFSVSAGTLAGFTGLAVKSSVELLKGAINNNTGDFSRLGPYLFIAAIPCSLVPQLFYLNEGLKHFGAIKFVPLYQSFLILANLFSGLVFFREFAQYDATSKGLFSVGCILDIIGVWILLKKVNSDGDESNSQNAPTTAMSQELV